MDKMSSLKVKPNCLDRPLVAACSIAHKPLPPPIMEATLTSVISI